MAENSEYTLEPLREESDFILFRGRERGSETPILALTVAAEQPSPQTLKRLEHEYSLAMELNPAWAAQPLALTRHQGRAALILKDPGGDLLDGAIELRKGQSIDLIRFLSIAIGLASALGQAHRQGLIHKDVRPANAFVDDAGRVWLTGFGIASRLPRERQAPAPPEILAGTLAYMSPEQTGRMNRSMDTRSDLYSLGVLLYQMLTGVLPFAAADPLEWIHCHIARQPVAPSDRGAVPKQLSAIVMKLLAKNAEDRYQTAAGLEADLRRCMGEWQLHGRINSFPIGADDLSDRLLIPEKLYGREREIEALLGAFHRVVAGGRPELILVSGYSGVGKSAVVNELHKWLVPPQGLFASGKFDQYKGDIPYATVAQAFQSLVQPLLSKPEAQVSKWRDDLIQELRPNGSLLLDLVPELKSMIGEQPPVVPLPSQEAKTRAHLAFRRFIGVFARPEHPLTLFFDDLQWLDAATLDFLEDVLVQQDLAHLLVVGAYRENEVDSTHPLMRKLSAIREAGATVQEIRLAPLSSEALAHLIADALHCESELAKSLAQLIHGKTAGNPFFATQFIHTLVEEELIAFEHGDSRWRWDLDAIRAKGHTDNVVELMVNKLNRLSVTTQKVLQQFACIGNHAEAAGLSAVLEMSEKETEEQLSEALCQELILRSQDGWRFVHDRVQEAAYSLIAEEVRAETHLRIGRLLQARVAPENRDEAIFEIVNQLNRGAELITSEDERNQVAELNLVAAKRAKASTAYASALNYTIRGESLLTDKGWELRRDLIYQLELQRAECEFLTGELAAAERRLTMLSSRAANAVERATVECLRIDLYTVLERPERAVTACLEYLRNLGIEWPLHPTEEQARNEYERIWSQLGNREIEAVKDFPLVGDTLSMAILDVLTKVLPAALFTDWNLVAMVICRAISLSLERGNSDASCVAYVFFAKVAGPRFGDYRAGFRFGQLGYELVEKLGFERFQARTCLWFAQFVVPWTKHVRACRGLMQRALEAATRVGDLTVVAYSLDNLTTNFLAAGDPLAEAQRQAEDGLEFAERMQFRHLIDVMATQLGLIRTLRGLTYRFGCFDDGVRSEALLEQHLKANPATNVPECWYWIRKLQARFFAGDYPVALDAAARARPILWTSAAMFETAEYHFYAALSHAACCTSATSGWDGPVSSRPAQDVQLSSHLSEHQEHFGALAAHHRQLEVWAENCPENFETRTALVGAEIARIQGCTLEAEHLYERAIQSAQTNGFVHNEALANELAARFYRTRGLEKVANAYLKDARFLYARWGADGKVKQLEEHHPQLRGERTAISSATSGPSTGQLDVESVLKASQAISSEIVLPTLIEKLVHIAMEHAGAERGLLILIRDGEPQIEAEGTTGPGGIEFAVRQAAITPSDLPQSALRYTIRTLQSVLLNDASTDNLYSKDEYVRQKRSRSVLCLPIVRQAKLVGALYLENNLAPFVFTPDRVAVLELLASQAAISLENASLYSDLQIQAGLLQRLPVSAWTLKPDGTPDFVNQVWLEFAGQDMEFVRSHPEAWMSAIHPEDREAASRVFWNGIRSGQGFAFETRSLCARDGKYRWHLQQAKVLRDADGNVLKFVGTTTDIDDLKRAEENLRESEHQFRLIVDSIPGLIALMSPGGDLEVVNRQLLEYFGQTLEELKGWGTNDTIHPEDMPRVADVLSRSIAAGTPYSIPQRYKRSDGVYRWFQNRGNPVRDAHGDIARWCVLLTDIDDQKRGEEALRESEQSFRLIFDGIAGLVTIMSATGETEVVNRQFLEYFGRRTEELKGWSIGDAVHPDDLPSVHSAWMHSVETGTVYDVDHRLRRTDGAYRWFHARGLPWCDPDGHVLRWYVLLTDIHDRKQAEEEVRHSEAVLAESQRLSLTGSFTWRMATDEITWSKELYRIFEIDQVVPVTFELIGTRVYPEDWPTFKELVERSRHTGSDMGSELRLQMPDRSIKYLHIVAHNRGVADQPEYIGAVQDVTQRRISEEALTKARSDLAHVVRVTSLGVMTASIAHEVNQPLSGIITNASTCLRMLNADPPNLEGARETARRTIRDGNRASDVIKRLRTLYSKKEPFLEPMDINEAAREVIALQLSDLQRNGAILEQDFADDLPIVDGDRIQLQQVILNLVRNASDAMRDIADRPRRLLIRTDRVDESVRVTIQDSGIGFDSATADRLFESFYTTKPEGMGIGLSVSRSIIEAHGGRLWATANDGFGATFAFSVPRKKAAGSGSEHASAQMP